MTDFKFVKLIRKSGVPFSDLMAWRSDFIKAEKLHGAACIARKNAIIMQFMEVVNAKGLTRGDVVELLYGHDDVIRILMEWTR